MTGKTLALEDVGFKLEEGQTPGYFLERIDAC